MKISLICLLSFAVALPAVGEPKLVGPVTFDRSHQYLMPSKAVGDEFQIDVILPIGYSESEEAYPVVFVTDSNYLLASAAATQLAQATEHLPKLILVGIGYDVPTISDTGQIRVRDFTPTCDQAYIKRNNQPKNLCGKADDFISFIKDELKPFINSKYRASDDTTLVGYSFGGTFALYALLTNNEIANRYIIGSANAEWDERVLFDTEAEYAKRHKDLRKTVYLSAGGLEGYSTIPNAYYMYEQLKARNYPGLALSIDVLDDETHMTAINSTVMRGLRWIFAEKQK